MSRINGLQAHGNSDCDMNSSHIAQYGATGAGTHWKKIGKVKGDDMESKLNLSGQSTDHIWAMEDLEGLIGLRLDCGDSGVVYFTKGQAIMVIDTLISFLVPDTAVMRVEWKPGTAAANREL